jgi:hypothetical protein
LREIKKGAFRCSLFSLSERPGGYPESTVKPSIHG